MRDVLAANSDVVAEIAQGKDAKGKKRKFLVGLVMKETRGQADAAAAAEEVDRALSEVV